MTTIRDLKVEVDKLRGVIKHLSRLVTCDMGEECAEAGHWEDCAITISRELVKAVE